MQSTRSSYTRRGCDQYNTLVNTVRANTPINEMTDSEAAPYE